MAFSQDDLKFKLTFDADTSQVQKSVEDIGKELDAQAKRTKEAWKDISRAGAEQLEAIQAHQKISAAFAAPEVINPRVEAMRSITRDMERQKDLIERINAEMDPDVLRERVALEKQLADARASYVSAHASASGSTASQEEQANKIKQGFRDLSSAGADQLESIQYHNRFTQAFAAQVKKKIDYSQLEGLAFGNAFNGGPDPDDYGPSVGSGFGGHTKRRQDDEESQSPLKKLLASFASGHGPNFRQFAGSVVGGGIGGGAGGAAGAAAGGIGSEALAALGPVGLAAGVATGGILLAVDAFSKLKNVAVEFAGLASPAVAFQWEYTVKDFKAVIGKQFVPFVEWMTTQTRGIADWINGGSSFGAAARPAHWSSDEDFQKQFQQQAYSASTMQGLSADERSTPQKQLEALNELVKLIRKQGGVVPPSIDNDPNGRRLALNGF